MINSTLTLIWCGLLSLVVITIEGFDFASLDLSKLNELTGGDANKDEKRCWLRSDVRGVGRPLSTCPADKDKSGALCYPKCKDGYKGEGPVCWQQCAEGLKDGGVTCAKAAGYGRGTGYASSDKCTKENKQGCEKSGLLQYPKCKDGFKAVGCCVCSPICPNEMTDAGAFCTKKSYGRTAGSPMSCKPNEENNAALCYDGCKNGFNGIGPVCWGSCPAGFNKCGAMCLEKSKCTQYLAEFLEPAANAIKSAATTDPIGGSKAVAAIVKKLYYPICNN
jgi:hypothetical protein